MFRSITTLVVAVFVATLAACGGGGGGGGVGTQPAENENSTAVETQQGEDENSTLIQQIKNAAAAVVAVSIVNAVSNQ